MSDLSDQTFAVLVRNEPGVLTKVAGIFNRYGFNIESLTVGKTQISGFSKIVVSLALSQANAERLRRRLENLVDVEQVSVLDPKAIRRIEVGIIRVHVHDPDEREEIAEEATEHGAVLVGDEADASIWSCTGTPEHVERFIRAMFAFHIRDTSRTGCTAIGPVASVTLSAESIISESSPSTSLAGSHADAPRKAEHAVVDDVPIESPSDTSVSSPPTVREQT